MQTATQQTQQTEVSLRTLGSDLKALAKGALAPSPEIIKIDQAGPDYEEGPAFESRPKKSRSFFALMLLIAILAIGYFFLYPLVKRALSPELIT